MGEQENYHWFLQKQDIKGKNLTKLFYISQSAVNAEEVCSSGSRADKWYIIDKRDVFLICWKSFLYPGVLFIECVNFSLSLYVQLLCYQGGVFSALIPEQMRMEDDAANSQ